jgi:hypothetical protein
VTMDRDEKIDTFVSISVIVFIVLFVIWLLIPSSPSMEQQVRCFNTCHESMAVYDRTKSDGKKATCYCKRAFSISEDATEVQEVRP